jgi:hypothetical protein
MLLLRVGAPFQNKILLHVRELLLPDSALDLVKKNVKCMLLNMLKWGKDKKILKSS